MVQDDHLRLPFLGCHDRILDRSADADDREPGHGQRLTEELGEHLVVVGEPGDATTYSASLDEGEIPVVDGVVSGQDITMSNLESGDLVVSFELAC